MSRDDDLRALERAAAEGDVLAGRKLAWQRSVLAGKGIPLREIKAALREFGVESVRKLTGSMRDYTMLAASETGEIRMADLIAAGLVDPYTTAVSRRHYSTEVHTERLLDWWLTGGERPNERATKGKEACGILVAGRGRRRQVLGEIVKTDAGLFLRKGSLGDGRIVGPCRDRDELCRAAVDGAYVILTEGAIL